MHSLFVLCLKIFVIIKKKENQANCISAGFIEGLFFIRRILLNLEIYEEKTH